MSPRTFAQPGLVKVDLHVHSSASFDCPVDPKQVAARCRQVGLSPVVLTDHNSVSGAIELRQAGVPTIVGEEIMTTQGELIGLFLAEAISEGLTAEEATARIKAQGGLVYLEHPYDRYRRHLSEEAIEALGESIDIVEVWNGRSDRAINQKAAQLCEILGAAAGAGSDAHRLNDIGSVYVEMEAFEGPADFLAKLRRGKIAASPTGFRLPKLRRS